MPNIQFTDEELQRVINALGELRFRDVYDLIGKISAQRAQQTMREKPAAQGLPRGPTGEIGADNGAILQSVDGAHDVRSRDH